MVKLILIFLFLMFISCNIKADCNAFEEHYRNDEYCSIIVEIPPKPSSVYFKTIGRSLKDGKPCKCEEESRWWATFSDQIKKGDTIIKKKGELIFYIHKRNKTIKINWECEGKIYK